MKIYNTPFVEVIALEKDVVHCSDFNVEFDLSDNLDPSLKDPY